MDIAEKASREIELAMRVHNFIDSLIATGYYGQCEVCSELHKGAAMLHTHFCNEHYPEISDSGKVKTFADCAGERYKMYLRSTRGF
jgi:hypothetical protein